MNSIADGSVIIQTYSQPVPSTPPWFGEVALIVQHLRRQGILEAICEQVRFARRRFGHYEVIDFVAVLFGYAISGERTLEAFYERLQPFAPAFMALFGRQGLPSRSTLSRFLASLTQSPVAALRTLFLEDLLARTLNKERLSSYHHLRTQCPVLHDFHSPDQELALQQSRCAIRGTWNLLPNERRLAQLCVRSRGGGFCAASNRGSLAVKPECPPEIRRGFSSTPHG